MALSSLSVVTNANRLRAPVCQAVSKDAVIPSGVNQYVEVGGTGTAKEETTRTTAPTVKDLVCGMEIDPNTAAAIQEYEGQLTLLLPRLP
jgi:hypothetical protein